MASRQLGTLYRELQRAFDARPTDLKRCGALLAQLKVSCKVHRHPMLTSFPNDTQDRLDTDRPSHSNRRDKLSRLGRRP